MSGDKGFGIRSASQINDMGYAGDWTLYEQATLRVNSIHM